MAARSCCLVASLVVTAWSLPLSRPQLSETQLVISADVQAGVLDVVSMADLDCQLAAVFDTLGYNGILTTVADASSHRLLQTGDVPPTMLQFKYTVRCPIGDCVSVMASLNNLRDDPAAGLAHAQLLIDAMNDILTPFGMDGSIISSAADIAAKIGEPIAVAITIPAPAPAPPIGGG